MWKKGTELVLEGTTFRRWAGILYIPLLLLLGRLLLWDYCIEDAKPTIIKICIGIGVALFLLHLFAYKEITPIVIDKRGITVDKYNTFPWINIDYVYTETESVNRRNTITYLIVEYHDSVGKSQTLKTEYRTEKFEKDDIEKAVNYWSGRQIGSLELKKRDEHINQMVDENREMTDEEISAYREKSDKYLPLFKDQYEKETIAGFISLLIYFIPMSFLTLMKMDDLMGDYNQATGYIALFVSFMSLGCFICSLVCYIVQKNFLTKENIKALTETERTDFFKMVRKGENAFKWGIMSIISAIITVIAVCVMVYEVSI